MRGDDGDGEAERVEVIHRGERAKLYAMSCWEMKNEYSKYQMSVQIIKTEASGPIMKTAALIRVATVDGCSKTMLISRYC